MTKQKIFIRTKGADGLARTTRRLRDQNFSVLPGHYSTGNGPQWGWGEYVSSQLKCSSSYTGEEARNQIPLLYASSGNEQPITTCGTPNLGWMEWGVGNRLPNVISLLTLMLPYTAAAWKFNTDLVAALGPKPKYRYTQYVGGNITTKVIPYADAGVLLKGRITELLKSIIALRNERQASVQNDSTGGMGGSSSLLKMSGMGLNGENPYDELEEELNEQLQKLRSDYETWKNTNVRLLSFLQNNNLGQVFLQLFADEEMFGICFPELQVNAQQLDATGRPVPGSDWTPEITGISVRPCHTTRLERMDGNNRINYVYVSNRWYDSPFVDMGHPIEAIDAIPSLSIQSPYADLTGKIRDARRQNLSVDKRPTRFVLPSVYPTPGHPYYPLNPWHSVYGGDIYEYAATIISDRLTRRHNSNVIGRVIYINNDYLNALYVQRSADTPEKKNALRDQMFNEINTWLRNRDNSGRSLVAFTFTGADGKEHESFKIVEIESASKNSAQANQTELSEVSSVIFFAMGLDSRLVGNTPGNESSSGGTDLRERYLLKQIQKSPTQKLVTKVLDVVRDFNRWDPEHLVWEIDREVLTTLDNSKTGITKQEQD